MLNIEEIKSTIAELEKKETSFSNCEKLAILYTVLDHNTVQPTMPTEQKVIREYSDILPSYTAYCNIKRKYQMNEVTKEAVEISIRNLCREINEFLRILYANTDTKLERYELKNMLESLDFLTKT